MSSSLLGLFSVFGAVTLAPVITALLGRLVRVPLVVVEILLGLAIGPALLGWVQPDGLTSVLSTLGVAMLFFLSGYEIDFVRIGGPALARAGLGWIISLVAGVIVGLAFAAFLPANGPSAITTGLFIGICLTSTALGTIMPTLRDAGETKTPFGRAVVAAGAAGQFGPLLALAIFLGGRHPLSSFVALLVFGGVIVLGVWIASRGIPPRLRMLVEATLHTSGQFAVRLVLFVLIATTAVSIGLGLDMLLGAFASGVLARLLLSSTPAAQRVVIEHKLEGIGYGVFIPIFFVQTGVTFDLLGLLAQPAALLMIPVVVLLFFVIRGVPGSLTLSRPAARSDRISATLLTGTALAVVVAVAHEGVTAGALSSTLAAALIGAGMCSVLLFPTLALSLRNRQRLSAERT